MKKNYARFICGLFCGALALSAAANALTPDKEFSQVENRNLAQRPALEAEALVSGKFMSDFEKYTTDQFVLRDAWVAGKANLEKLIGKRENNGVYFCDDGSLITRFEQPDWAKVDKNLGYVDAFAQKAGVPVTFGLIPTQSLVWSGKLPAGAPNADQQEVYDRASQTIQAATLEERLWQGLCAHRDEPVFYRTDHHWTSLGAYYGYAGLGEALGYTPVPLESYTKTTMSTAFYGTVFSSSGVRWVEPDEMDIYVPESYDIQVTSFEFDSKGNMTEVPRQLYEERYLEKKDKYSMFLGGQQALGVVRVAGNEDKPKLLLIRDSYSDSLVPFLTAHFSEIHLIDPRYYKLSPSQYIAEHGIDQALVLYSVPNFVSDGNLLWISR